MTLKSPGYEVGSQRQRVFVRAACLSHVGGVWWWVQGLTIGCPLARARGLWLWSVETEALDGKTFLGPGCLSLAPPLRGALVPSSSLLAALSEEAREAGAMPDRVPTKVRQSPSARESQMSLSSCSASTHTARFIPDEVGITDGPHTLGRADDRTRGLALRRVRPARAKPMWTRRDRGARGDVRIVVELRRRSSG